MRAHRSRFRAVLASAIATALALTAAIGAGGCGGVPGAASSQGDELTVYASLPLQGPSAAISQQIVGGEKLALSDAGARVGPFKVSYALQDDASPTSGRWEAGLTETSARTAADDPTTIAYLGDYDSAATAISLPLINAAGIVQISPASPYGGLTSSLYAGQDEPERFYPTGKRSFARLQPGDEKQARAQIQVMQALGIKRLFVLDDEDPFQLPLAQMVVSDAERAGIDVKGHASLDTSTSSSFSGQAATIAGSGAEAVFFAGGPGKGALALFEQLHAHDGRLWLLGSSALVEPTFTSALGAGAAARTRLTTPVLPVSMYPASGERVLAAYRRRYGEQPEAYVLFGYEAMSAALQAIRRAGRHGDNREAVIDAFFARGERDSVIGRYAIEADGETTLSSYGVDRISAGMPVFWRALSVR